MEKLLLFLVLPQLLFCGPEEDKALFAAIDNMNAEETKQAIKNGADVNAVNQKGLTPLLIATAALLEQPMHEAGNLNNKYRFIPSIVQTLIDSGANVNSADKNKETPLLNAISTGNISIVKMLLDAGADVTQKGRHNLLPLESAKRIVFLPPSDSREEIVSAIKNRIELAKQKVNESELGLPLPLLKIIGEYAFGKEAAAKD